MRIEFDDIEISMLQELKLPFDVTKDITDDEYFILDEKVADAIMNNLDENYAPTLKGRIFERIMDKISQA